MKRSDLAISVREMTLFAVLGAMTFGAKYVMSFLPNVEPVSLMVMLFAVTFGRKWVYPVCVYVAMEILFYGLGVWNINYLYIWAVLAAGAYLMRNMRHPLGWAMFLTEHMPSEISSSPSRTAKGTPSLLA